MGLGDPVSGDVDISCGEGEEGEVIRGGEGGEGNKMKRRERKGRRKEIE